MEQDELLAKINRVMGKDYTHKSLLETIEELVNRVELLQDSEKIVLDQNKRFRQRIFDLRRKTGYRVYEENLRLTVELAKSKEVLPV